MAVRELVHKDLGDGKAYCEFAGKTADTKPVADYILTGSKYFDIQTGKTYYYDEAGSTGSEWIDPTA